MNFLDRRSPPTATDPAIVLTAALAVCFTFIAWWTGTEAGSALDRHLLLALQSVGDTTSPRGPAWLNEAGRDLTALGSISVLTLSTALVTGWLLLTRQLSLALGMLIVIAGGISASFMLKWGFSQPRPDLVSEATQVFTSSFPSSHAMSSLVTFVALAAVLGRQGTLAAARRYMIASALILSLVSGFSRVYLGVHWPSDVIGGWMAGAVWLLVADLGRRLLLTQMDRAKN